jgi:hypothetical protein
VRALALLGAVAMTAALACTPVSEIPEELALDGQLDRDSISDTSQDAVDVDYRSEGARGEWWPCDLRLTAQGCVGDHHVNVYVTLPSAQALGDVGAAACVSGDTAEGVYELFQAAGGGTHAIGADVGVFVLVASDVDETTGAVLNDDAETTAAARLTSGEVVIGRWAGLDHIGLTVDGQTAQGRTISVAFDGPLSQPGVVPTLEGPSTCVDSALK